MRCGGLLTKRCHGPLKCGVLWAVSFPPLHLSRPWPFSSFGLHPLVLCYYGVHEGHHLRLVKTCNLGVGGVRGRWCVPWWRWLPHAEKAVVVIHLILILASGEDHAEIVDLFNSLVLGVSMLVSVAETVRGIQVVYLTSHVGSIQCHSICVGILGDDVSEVHTIIGEHLILSECSILRLLMQRAWVLGSLRKT